MSNTPHVCFDRRLPDITYVPGQARIALLKAKLFQPGTTLRIAFSGGSKTEHRLVGEAIDELMKYANIDFQMTKTGQKGDVRITFNSSGGAWSYIGTDIFNIASNRATMNLGFMDGGTVLHEFCHCLDGDTLIDCPRDLEKYPKGIPIKDLVGKKPWVFAWKDGQIVVRKASRVWLSKRNAKTVRVKLRTGQGSRNKNYLPPLELAGTLDHPVLLADGKTWKNLGDLEPGDRLCSLYRSNNVGGKLMRTRLKWTGAKQGVMEHSFVCQQVYGDRPEHYDCHHKNERTLDQSVRNLEWKEKSEHARDHALSKGTNAFAGRKHTPASKAKMAAAQLGRKASPETRTKMSASHKARGISPENRKKMLAGRMRFLANGGRSGMYGKRASQKTRAKQSAAIKAWHKRKREEAVVANHVVVSVESAGIRDVYDMTVPDADNFVANGVVVHNSLGAIHEHQNPAGGIKWNKEQVIRDLSGSPNFWDRETIEHNMFKAYSMNQINGTTFDPRSIMLYAIPKRWTLDGFSSEPNSTLSEMDKAWLRKQYPGKGEPEPDVKALLVPTFKLTPTGEKIGEPGERDLFAFDVDEKGHVRVECLGPTTVVLRLYGPNDIHTLIAETNNAGVSALGFNTRLDANLTPARYYAQVAHADPRGTGHYGVRILQFAENDPLLDDEPQGVVIRSSGTMLPGEYVANRVSD